MDQMEIKIRGMHCRSCELLLEEKIGAVQGVKVVRVDHRDGSAVVSHDSDVPSEKEIEAAVVEAGYSIGEAEKKPWISRDFADYRNLGIAALVILAAYYAAKGFGLTDISIDTGNVTYSLALTVGLVAGISTCMALVGGLVLGISARHAERHPEATAWQKFRPHLYFNLGRVGGYAVLGGLLGAAGGVLKLSGTVLALLTLAVGIVMVALGMKLTGISPRLADSTVALPSWISRRLGIGRHAKEYSHRGSLMTGALTFFLPCGFTQAMQIFAVSTGSFGRGAMIMALFALGTAPALLSIGGLTSVIKGAFAKKFYAIVGLAVLVFGVLNVGNAMALVGFVPGLGRTSGATDGLPPIQDGVQVVRMKQEAYGYVPSSFKVRKGVPVRWVITSENAYTCAASIVMPSMRINKYLAAGENVIEFTPDKVGTLPFSCSMGMYRGSFTVVDPAETAGSADGRGGGVAALGASGSCGGGGGGCGGGGAKTVDPTEATESGGVQKVNSKVGYGGLSPNTLTVTAGSPVEWTIESSGPPAGCMVGFLNDELGIDERQRYPGATVVKFTPEKQGEYDITCPMGMWRATVKVI